MEEPPIHPELGLMVEIDDYDGRLRERNLEIKRRWERESEPRFPLVGIKGGGMEMGLLSEYFRSFWPQMRNMGISEENFGEYWRWVDKLLDDPLNPHQRLLAFCLRFCERWEVLRQKRSSINLKLLKQVTLRVWLEIGVNNDVS